MSAVWEKVARWTGEERMGELLLAHYGLRLEGAVPVGGVLKIDTNRGTFALKRAGEGGESHWRGVAEVDRPADNAPIRMGIKVVEDFR